MGQYKVELDVGDKGSTGELVLLGTRVALSSLPENSEEPSKVELDKAVTGESVQLAAWPDFMDIGDSNDVSEFHDG